MQNVYCAPDPLEFFGLARQLTINGSGAIGARGPAGEYEEEEEGARGKIDFSPTFSPLLVEYYILMRGVSYGKATPKFSVFQ